MKNYDEILKTLETCTFALQEEMEFLKSVGAGQENIDWYVSEIINVQRAKDIVAAYRDLEN